MLQATKDLKQATYQGRIAAHYKCHEQTIDQRTDRLFVWLMLFQWVACITLAVFLSPYQWEGTVRSVHIHVWAGLILGGTITLVPVCMGIFHSGHRLTRHVIAIGQMMMSALLIHISGGRIETHFHVFGSLAILAFYRDWRVLITASVIVYLDHFIRGIYWPQSVYGVLSASSWRAVEHAAWVGFEVFFLAIAIRQSQKEMWSIAERQTQLEMTNESIERLVEQRTAELQRRTTQLEDSQKQMEAFCYSVSHDLRAPLRAMHGFSTLLIDDYSPSMDNQALDYIRRIAGSARQMEDLVRDLLAYSRLGQMEMTLDCVDLKEVLEEAFRLLSVEIETSAARIDVDLKVPLVFGHKAVLIQVVMNLVSNAIKFVKPGRRAHLRISSSFEQERVLLCFQDNGIGILPEYQSKIFGVFERLHSVGEYPGTGIGLAIVKRGVEKMGGTVSLKSTTGEGSVFQVELTCAPAE